MHVSDESNVSGQHKSTVGWPGLPKEDYTVSFWLANARNSHHLERRTTQDLPTEVDLCIIGSGLSGVMLVYFLMTALADSKDPQEPLRILMLEARQFCHGATGRNGGHCRPDTYLGYPGYKACFGSAEAMRLIDLELETLNLLDDIIEKEKIECDFWKGEGMDVFMSQSIATEARQALEEYERDGGTIKNAWLGDKAEAEKASRVKGAVAACTYSAGSLYPYKLASGLLDVCLKQGLNFQCETPVTSVTGSALKWTVRTPRGDVQASKVVFSTNAYSATLLPELKTCIVPIRGHCAAITPTRAFSGDSGGMLRTTQIIRWGAEQLPPGEEGDFEYLIQRPSDGKIILGGKSDPDFKDNIDDSAVIQSSADALKRYMSELYQDWGTERPGEGISDVWTGIMGLTESHVPIVSAIPNKQGQYINAGHNGHGMARIARCSQGLAKLIMAGPEADFKESGLPLPLKWTSRTIPEDAEWYRKGSRHQSLGQTTSGIPEVQSS